MIDTLYCATWDYFMDWGILRSFKPHTFLLRDKLTFKASTYYIAIAANFCLRFIWLLGVFTFPQDQT